MNGRQFLILVAVALLATVPARGYEWYHVRVDSVDHPTYEIQFAEGVCLAGTEGGVFRGLGAEPWHGMGLEYPGLGAYSILYVEGSGWRKQIINAEAIPGATGVGIGDVDGSGYADIIVAAKDPSDRVVWFQNPLPDSPALNWTPIDVQSPAWGAREVALADIDGDDDLDIAAALRDEDIIVWYEAGDDADPVSWERHDVGPALGPRGVYVADINADGRPDIVAGSMNDGTVLWFEAPEDPGSGEWVPHILDTELAGVKGVFACDLDRDDDLDVIAAGRDAGQVVWYEQISVGPCEWDKHIIDPDLPGAVSVWCGNLVGDALPEVAVTAKTSGWVVVYERHDDAPETWVRTIVDDALPEACPLSAGDIDGDGRTDLVAAGKVAGVVAWYRAPSWQGLPWRKTVIDDDAGSSMGITAGDVDGDGDCDVVATSCMEGNVTWYENDQREIYCGFSEGSGLCESDGIYKWHDIQQEWVPSWWCARPYFLTEHPLLPGQYFCGNHYGLFLTSDFVHWEDIGGAALPDSVRCIWFHPDDPTRIMVGTHRGLYRSAPYDPGWERALDVPPLPVMDIETAWPYVGPPEALVLASGGMGSFSHCLYRSTDFGASWEHVLTLPQPTDLLQDLTTVGGDPVVMFMGTAGDGIQRVDAAGNILGNLNAGLPDLMIHRMQWDPYIDTPAIFGCTQGGLYECMLLETSAAETDSPVPTEPACLAWPNPWRTEVVFQLNGAPEPVRVRVYDPTGREVWCSGAVQSGSIAWNGRDVRGRRVGPGVYFYRLDARRALYTGKILRLR